MRKWTKTAGILFMAASAVYSGKWIVAATADAPVPTGAGAAAKPVDDSDPFATGPSTTTQPSSDAASPTTQPAAQGQSVTASQVNVSDTGTVEIHVNDANLVEVLRMLSLQSQKNIIASKEVHGTVTANLYDVTVKEALDAILHANGYDYREKGNFIYVYTTKELQDLERAAQVKRTEVFRLFYTNVADAQNLIKPVLSNEAIVALSTPAKGGLDDTILTFGGNDSAHQDLIVVTDYPENLEKARKLLKEIDRRPQQVLVEATILVAELDENNSLGIDFTLMGGVDFSNLANAVSGSSGGAAGGTGATGGTSTNSSGSGVTDALTGQIRDNPNATTILNRGYTATQLGGTGLKFGLVTHNISVFVNALEGITDTTVLANPKVLVLNKQKGQVLVGQEEGYKTAVATETLTASDVKFLDVGTRLIFRPYIGDNGYVRLEIHPEDSDGSVNDQGLPNKSTTEVTTNVQVKDGHTIVIGGLFRDSTKRSRSQVPFLGSLPGIGPLFRQQTDTTKRQEIIILLTPHIIKDMDAENAAADQESKFMERMRVGMRRGLMPWGRERLAESWYEEAVQEMNKPHPNRNAALWHLNCAINLNPLFTEAEELRAQIMGKEVTAADNSSIRKFLRREILAERASGSTTEPFPAAAPVDQPNATQTKDESKPQDAKPSQAQSGKNPGTNQQTAEGPSTQPAEAKNDGGVQFTYPSTQPGQPGQDATATTDLPDDAVQDAHAPADDNK